ncbi:MAG: serine/threonine-protein kinase [Planctomycetota bacterium]|jgi:serine/threonine-protein kinase
MSGRSVLALLEEAGRRPPRLKLRSPADETRPAIEARRVFALGRYEVQGEIARGGVGVVCRGYDVDLGREVAVKFLHERHLRKLEIVQRFVEEAQIAGQLQHPGIVPIYELGLQARRRPFFTMKLVTGRTFERALAERRDQAEERHGVLSVLERVCQTVAYAHARGVIHRDLKPANVMIGRFGEVQVLDWGFAKILRRAEEGSPPRAVTQIATVRSETSASRAGTLLGTPAYMPPEQAMGRVDELDERSDVFALGAILCEILTGKPPYVPESGDVLRQATTCALEDAHERLEACRADEDLVELCRACLSKLPRGRPRDAGLVAQAVSAHLAAAEARAHRSRLAAIEQRAQTEQSQARAAEARAAAAHQKRRRRQVVALAAAVLLCVAVAGGGWLWIERGRWERAQQTEREVNEAFEEAKHYSGVKEWGKAVVAARRAADLAARGAASGQKRAEVDALLVAVLAEDEQEQARLARVKQDRELIARLADLRVAQGDGLGADPERTDADYAAAFRAADRPADEIAQAIRTRSELHELIGALGEWAALRLRHGGNWKGLWRAAGDDAGDRESLRALAAGDLGTVPADRLVRAAVMLDALGDTDAAVELLRKARKPHRGSFWIHLHLATFLLRLDPPPTKEAIRSLTAALALRPESACLWHQLGRAHQLDGDYEEALAAHRRAVASDPHHAAHHHGLGVLLREAGDPSEAVAELRKAIDLDRSSAEAQRALGLALQGSGDLEEAVAVLRVAADLGPARARVHFALGNALLQKGDPHQAVAAHRQAAALDPDEADHLSSLGVALHRCGDHASAMAAFERALELRPGFAAARYNCGLARHAAGDLEGAVADLRRAFELDPDIKHAHSDLGVVLSDGGTLEGAASVFSEWVEAWPDQAANHCDLGHVLRRQKKLGAAIAAYERALELAPDHAPAHDGMGVALTNSGKLRRALAALGRAVELAPRDGDVHVHLGFALCRGGRFGRAVKVLEKAVDLDPRNARAHSFLGFALSHRGRPRDVDRAVAEARASLTLDPSVAAAWNMLGALLCDRVRDYEGAIRAFHAAIRLKPGNANFHTNLANALKMARDPSRAIEAYRRVLDIRPRSHRALNNLGGILSDVVLDHASAADAFRACSRIRPRDATYRLNLGRALRGLGDVDGAMAAFREAIDLEPDQASAYHELGLTYLRQQDFPHAVAEFREAVLRAPEDVHYRIDLAGALKETDEIREAIATYREALRRDPSGSEPLEPLAWLLVVASDPHLRDPEDAMELAAKAVEVDPGLLSFSALGAAQYRAGRLGHAEEAREAYARANAARQRRPSEPELARLCEEAKALLEQSDG